MKISAARTRELAKDFLSNHISSLTDVPMVFDQDASVGHIVSSFETASAPDGTSYVKDAAKCMAFVPWEDEPVMVVPMSAVVTLTQHLSALATILSVVGIGVPSTQEEYAAALRRAAELQALAFSSPYVVEQVSMSAPGPDGHVGVALKLDSEKLARITPGEGDTGQPTVLKLKKPDDPRLN